MVLSDTSLSPMLVVDVHDVSTSTSQNISIITIGNVLRVIIRN